MRRSGSHTTHGTHPECSGNAPPTAARAHAWRGGYPYHAHFDLAAGSTHPPPIHMLIVRPGTPPHICTARIAQAAQRAAHCRGALHSGGASFPYPVPDPATTAQRPAPITTPGTLRPAPSQRPATTSDIITTPGTTYARPTATTTITPTVTSSVTSTVTSSVATTRHPPYYNRRQPPVCCCRIAQVAPRAHLSRQQHHHQRPLPPNRQFHRRVRCFSAPPTRALRPLFAWLPRLHPRSFLCSTCSAPTPEF